MKSRQRNKYRNKWTHDDAGLAGNKANRRPVNLTDHQQTPRDEGEKLDAEAKLQDILGKIKVENDSEIQTLEPKAKRKTKPKAKLLERLVADGVITQRMANKLKAELKEDPKID